MLDIVQDVGVAHYEAAYRGERLGAGSHYQVHFLAGQAEMLAGAVAATAQYAGGVGVVHHKAGAVLAADLGELGDGGDVAFHGEHAVHYDQLAVPGTDFFKDFIQAFGVVVFKAAQFAVGKPAAVQYAGVVQLVHYRKIAFADQGRYNAKVHLVAGGVNKGGFAALESRQFALQFHVQHGIAVEKARARHACAEFLYRFDGRGLHAGVVRQAQVVVGAEHYKFFTLDRYLRGLLGFKGLEIRVDPGFYQLFYNVEIPALIKNVGHNILIFY